MRKCATRDSARAARCGRLHDPRRHHRCRHRQPDRQRRRAPCCDGCRRHHRSAVGHDRAGSRDSRYGSEARGDYRESRPYDVERCDVRYDEEYRARIDGYRVTYVYNGREHTTRLPYDPGDRIRVRVDVHPEDCD